MNDFKLFAEGTEIVVTKDDEVFCKGRLIPTISSYSFEMETPKGVVWSMESRGLFWWRKLELSKNGEFEEYFSINSAKATGLTLSRRNFVYLEGKYILSIDYCRGSSEFGKCLRNWSNPLPIYEIQIVCLAVLEYISRLQYPYGA